MICIIPIQISIWPQFMQYLSLWRNIDMFEICVFVIDNFQDSLGRWWRHICCLAFWPILHFDINLRNIIRTFKFLFFLIFLTHFINPYLLNLRLQNMFWYHNWVFTILLFNIMIFLYPYFPIEFVVVNSEIFIVHFLHILWINWWGFRQNKRLLLVSSVVFGSFFPFCAHKLRQKWWLNFW